MAEASPFPDELESSGIEAAGQHVAVRRDRGAAAGVVGVKVGHGVVVDGVAVGDGRLLCLRSISDSCGRGLIGAAVSAVFTCWALMAAAAWLALSA